jgi:hypothetical protein
MCQSEPQRTTCHSDGGGISSFPAPTGEETRSLVLWDDTVGDDTGGARRSRESLISLLPTAGSIGSGSVEAAVAGVVAEAIRATLQTDAAVAVVNAAHVTIMIIA